MEGFFISVLFFWRPGGLSPLAFFPRLKKARKKELRQRLNPWRSRNYDIVADQQGYEFVTGITKSHFDRYQY